MKSVQGLRSKFEKERPLKPKQKESNIKPMNIDSSALMFSIKDKHGFNAKDRKRMVDKEKEKEAQLKNKRKSFVNHMKSSDSLSSEILNTKSGNMVMHVESGYINHKSNGMQLNNYTGMNISDH